MATNRQTVAILKPLIHVDFDRFRMVATWQAEKVRQSEDSVLGEEPECTTEF